MYLMRTRRDSVSQALVSFGQASSEVGANMHQRWWRPWNIFPTRYHARDHGTGGT